MHDTAAHLVEGVIPQVPVRQWVFSLPRWARFLLARDPQLITCTLDIALRGIFAWQRRRARRAGAVGPRAGAVTFVQRFGGALNLNVHFHCVIPDGVFVREGGGVRFVELAPPSDDEVMEVLRRVVARLERLLRPKLASTEADARPLDALGAAQAEAMNSLGTPPSVEGRVRKRAAYLEGFSLHAAVHLHANDREGLANLCGYGARPPFSQERLSQLPDGRLAYRLKRPLATVARRSCSSLASCCAASPRWFRRRARTSCATTASSPRHPAGAARWFHRPSPQSNTVTKPLCCPRASPRPRRPRKIPAAPPGPSCCCGSFARTCSPAPAGAAAWCSPT